MPKNDRTRCIPNFQATFALVFIRKDAGASFKRHISTTLCLLCFSNVQKIHYAFKTYIHYI